MPVDAAPGSQARTSDGEPDAWRIPLWVLQVLEFALAYLLVSQSVHVAGGALLATSGVLLGLCTLSLDAPLGVVRVCSPRVHRFLIRLLAAAMSVAVAIPGTRPDVEGIVIVVFAAVALVVLSTRAAALGGTGRRRRGAPRGEVIDATATVVPTPDRPATETESGDADSAVRKAGRTAGAAAAVGKRAADEYRPQVEDQVKRTIRGAGRFAGRLSGTKSPPDGASGADRT